MSVCQLYLYGAFCTKWQFKVLRDVGKGEKKHCVCVSVMVFLFLHLAMYHHQ